MDYFRLKSGDFVRVIDVKEEMWVIDMVAEGEYASIYNGDSWYVPFGEIVYEVDAIEMAVRMLESMKRMDWCNSRHIMKALEELAEKFKGELEFYIDVAFGALHEQIFTISIQELRPFALPAVIEWHYRE